MKHHLESYAQLCLDWFPGEKRCKDVTNKSGVKPGEVISMKMMRLPCCKRKRRIGSEYTGSC